MATVETGIVINASVEDEASKKVAELAGALDNLSKKTGLTVTELEKLTAAEDAVKTSSEAAAPKIEAVTDAISSASVTTIDAVAASLSSAGAAAGETAGEVAGVSSSVASLSTDTAGSAETFKGNMKLMADDVIAIVSGIVIVIAEVIEAMNTLAGETAEYGDGVQKGAEKIDFSTDAYQEWDYVLQKNGSSMKKAEGAITKLEESVGKGSDKTAQALGDLGISLEDAQKMSGDELFQSVIAGLQELEKSGDHAKTVATASELMGNKYKDLGTVLTSTGEETEALKDRAHDLGLVMSEEGIQSSVDYKDALEDLEATAEGIRRAFGEELTKALGPAKEAMLELLTSINWTELAQALGSALEPAVRFVTEFVIPLASVSLGGVIAMLTKLLELLGKLGHLGNQEQFIESGVQELLEEGAPLEELEQNLINAQEAFNAAQAALDEADDRDAGRMIQLRDDLQAKSDELEIATEAYNRALAALGETGEGETGETPAPEGAGTPAEVEETAAAAAAAVKASGDMLQTYTETAGEINAAYTAGVDEASQAAVEAIENTHNTMDENMALLDANAYIWGTDMMLNFANGIINGANSYVVPALKQIARKIDNLIGFSEPSEGPLADFHTFAPDMMALFAKGIRDGRGLIESAIGHSFDLGPMIASQARGTNLNYGGVSVQIYGAPGQSVDELYDVFSYRLARDVADRQVVFST